MGVLADGRGRGLWCSVPPLVSGVLVMSSLAQNAPCYKLLYACVGSAPLQAEQLGKFGTGDAAVALEVGIQIGNHLGRLACHECGITGHLAEVRLAYGRVQFFTGLEGYVAHRHRAYASLRVAVYGRVCANRQPEGAERWQAHLVAFAQQPGQHVGKVLQHLFGRSTAFSSVGRYHLGQFLLLYDLAVDYAREEPRLAVIVVSLWWHLLPFYVYGHRQIVFVWFVISSFSVRSGVLHRPTQGWTVRATILHRRMKQASLTVQPWVGR